MAQDRPPSSPGMPSWAIPGVVIALILAGGVAFAGYEIGNRTSSPSATPTPTASPISTATSTPTPAPIPEATSTPASTATGASPTSTPQPTSTSVPQNPRIADPGIIRSHGYTPVGQWAWTGDGHGGRVYAWIATCANSGDGYCQKVFFFHGTTWLGTDTAKPSRQIMAVIGEGNLTRGISVQYANYNSSDPMCCPTGSPVTVLYTWNGSGLVAGGTPPGQ